MDMNNTDRLPATKITTAAMWVDCQTAGLVAAAVAPALAGIVPARDGFAARRSVLDRQAAVIARIMAGDMALIDVVLAGFDADMAARPG